MFKKKYCPCGNCPDCHIMPARGYKWFRWQGQGYDWDRFIDSLPKAKDGTPTVVYRFRRGCARSLSTASGWVKKEIDLPMRELSREEKYGQDQSRLMPGIGL